MMHLPIQTSHRDVEWHLPPYLSYHVMEYGVAGANKDKCET
jgi:hypothetical protein